MEPLQSLLGIYRSNEPAAALRSLVEDLSPSIPLRCGVWIDSGTDEPLCAHPGDARLPDEVLTVACSLTRPEVFSLESLSPVGAARYPGADMLILPLLRDGASCGTVVLIADRDSFGDAAIEEEWHEIVEALAAVEDRCRQLRETEEERAEFQRRMQEMEVLDVLGLSVNRTLDRTEVLSLVARFTRTLLGAHYAVVFTLRETVQALAAVGLRGQLPEADDDPLARRVIEGGKPIVLGPGGEPFDPMGYPLHERQKMKVGFGVPLSLFGETFGALVVGYRDEYPVSSRDTLLALNLAHHAAVAINNARLHSELAERSGQLAERSEELERANEELRQISLQKERFFTSISHELRTPLGGILGYQSLLLEGVAGEFPEAARNYVEKAHRSAKSMLHLVNEILDYGKIQAGKLEMNFRAIEPHELFEDALASVEPLIAQKGLVLKRPALDSMQPVRTDPDRVRQILVNLLANAIKFSPEGGEIRLSAEEVDGEPDGADWLEIRVRDTGPGIGPADQETIFLEFEQVAGTRGGTGLGLPISRQLARLLNGDLVVESELGSGSTFILRLPRRQSPAAEDLSSNAA